MGKAKNKTTTKKGTSGKVDAEGIQMRASKEPAKQTTRPLPASLERRAKKKKKNTKPVWIQYYEREARDPDSDYGQGFHKPSDHFEHLMEEVVSDEDALYEALKQNLEACSLVYADGAGLVRTVHHLTAAVHGNCIIVGLEGFGGKSSQVKVINSQAFMDRVQLDDDVAALPVPKLEKFLTNELDDIEALVGIDAKQNPGAPEWRRGGKWCRQKKSRSEDKKSYTTGGLAQDDIKNMETPAL